MPTLALLFVPVPNWGRTREGEEKCIEHFYHTHNKHTTGTKKRKKNEEEDLA
jgi:hypothetical protein